MTTFRNWIEERLESKITGSPVYVGSRGGRKVYEVTTEDGSSNDYFIDFDSKTIEEA